MSSSMSLQIIVLVLLMVASLLLNAQASHWQCTNDGSVRLSEDDQGRVDLCIGGRWHSPCQNDTWGSSEAQVVCRQLGYCSQGGNVILNSQYSNPWGYYKQINCLGTETSLNNCSVTTAGSNCMYAAGVSCISTAPYTPTNARIQVTSSTALQISWNAPSMSGCRDVDGYTVRCTTSTHTPVCSTLIVNASSNSNTATLFSDQLFLCNYQCRVRGYNSAGNGQYSQYATIPIPDAPSIETARAWSTLTSIRVSWSRPSFNYHLITNYKVYYREAVCTNCLYVSRPTSSIRRSRVINGLWPYTSYYIYVRAINVAGPGLLSSIISTRTMAAYPSAPINVGVTTVQSSTTALHVSWIEPQYPNGTLTYTIRCNSLYDTLKEVNDLRATSYTMTQLKSFTNYNCCVSASNTVPGEGTPECDTGQTRLLPPTEFINSSLGQRSIGLTWNQLEDTHGQHYSFILDCSETSTTVNPQQMRQTLDRAELNFIFNNARPYTRYECCISAMNSESSSMRSCINAQTHQSEPTRAPAHLQIERMSSNELSLSWNELPYQYRNGVIRWYIVQICNIVSQPQTCTDHQASGTSITINDLHPYYNYTWSVAAYTVDRGPYSDPITFQMPEDVPTGTPQGIFHYVLSSSEIKLSWRPPLFDKQNGVITGYKIRVFRDDSSLQSSLFVRGTTLTVSSLNENTQYKFEIAAQTVIGVGPYHIYGTVRTAIGAAYGILIAGMTILGIIILVAIVLVICYCYCRKKIAIAWKKRKSLNRTEQHLYEDPDVSLAQLQTSTCSQKAAADTNQEDEKLKLKSSKKKSRPGRAAKIRSWLERNNRRRGRGKDLGDGKVPQIPERRYLEDDDFVNEHLQDEQPEIPERRYIDTISLATHMSEDTTAIPPRNIIRETGFTRSLQDNENQTETETKSAEKIYQPLIPPRLYEESHQETSSDYQSLTFQRTSNKEVNQKTERVPTVTNNSEGHYQALVKRDETSEYQPITFGASGKPKLGTSAQLDLKNFYMQSHDKQSSYEPVRLGERSSSDLVGQTEPVNHSEGQYQALVKREESNPYQSISFGTN